MDEYYFIYDGFIMPGSETIQALERGLKILELVAASDKGLRIKDLSDSIGLKASTVHNLVRTLRNAGYLEQIENGRSYRLGPAAISLATTNRNGRLLAAFEDKLRRLAGAYPLATATYSELLGGEMKVMRRLSPDLPGIVQRPDTMTLGLYNSASGIAGLAFLDEAGLEKAQAALPPLDFATRFWRTLDDLEDAIAKARKDGYAVHPLADARRCALAVPAPVPGSREISGVFGMSWGANAVRYEIQKVVDALRDIIRN